MPSFDPTQRTQRIWCNGRNATDETGVTTASMPAFWSLRQLRLLRKLFLRSCICYVLFACFALYGITPS